MMFTPAADLFAPEPTSTAWPAPAAAMPAPPAASVLAAPSRDSAALETVLRHPGVWRRKSPAVAAVDVLPSGHAVLDALLPGGGWPRGALCELLSEHDGLGECSLLLPTLAALTRARRRVVLVAPPYIPYAPALAAAGVDLQHVVQIDAAHADTHWTAEQCLRSGCCGAVLHWLAHGDYRELRRLQLAAESSGTPGFVFRPLAAASQASPSALRLRITSAADGTRFELIKCRGRVGGTTQLRLRA